MEEKKYTADGMNIEVDKYEDKKIRERRIMDRSRRATNPDNYNEDGTVKKQGNKKFLVTSLLRSSDTKKVSKVHQKNVAIPGMDFIHVD